MSRLRMFVLLGALSLLLPFLLGELKLSFMAEGAYSWASSPQPSASAAVYESYRDNPLLPVRVDHPRATLRSFMSAMNDYREGQVKNDKQLIRRIDDAVRTLDLRGSNGMVALAQAKEAAILLKEVIDRHIVIRFDLVDGSRKHPFWQLKGSDFTIRRIGEGSREGEYLISADTVARAREFYDKIKHKPYLSGSGQGALYSEPLMQRKFPQWAQKNWIFFPNWQWLGLFLSILLGLVIRVLVSHATHLLERVTDKIQRADLFNKVLLSVDKQAGNIAASAFWFMMIYLLRFEGRAQVILLAAVQVFLSYAVIRAFYSLVDVLTGYLSLLTSQTENTLDDHLLPLVGRSLKIFVIVFGVLVAFQNLGFNVMSVLAGLGLGGLAFALAAQDTCANLFGSLMILVDRPFQIGDWINVDGMEGNVEDIGFRSTRIRTFYNSEVSVPNSKIAKSNIDNYGRRKFRRQVLNLGVAYDTAPEKMEAFLEGIKNIIKANPNTRKDYFHVVFRDYGPSSLDVMVYFFIVSPDWSSELVERQNVLMEILRLAHHLEVAFAFPTQTIHVESTPEHPLSKQTANDDAQLAKLAQDYGPGGKLAKPGGLGIFTPPYKD